ncbi:MAG: hypothetical protein ABI395_01325 [Sphingobium sp.]
MQGATFPARAPPGRFERGYGRNIAAAPVRTKQPYRRFYMGDVLTQLIGLTIQLP